METIKEKVQRIIHNFGVDGFIITNIKNIRYLSNFTGSSALIFLTKDKGFFFTDFRYKEQAYQEVSDYEIVIEDGKRIRLLDELTKKHRIKKLGFEGSVSYEFYEELKSLSIPLQPMYRVIEDLRMIKNEEEILKIKKAIERAEDAFLKLKPFIRVGKTERQIALKMEENLKRKGCKSLPFDIIVASGKNSALPHAKPTDKKIEKGDLVIIDWGGEFEGYFSDMARTFIVEGDDLSEKIRLYNVVNTARKKAIEFVKARLTTTKLDKIARDEIKAAGYGRYFGHGLGHGVGLDVHEQPAISRTGSGKILKNMVFTIEPGIYIPNIGGVRIEDMVLVDDDKAIVLTNLSREIEIIKGG
jgi:Xaa-Pro aminopeptidase